MQGLPLKCTEKIDPVPSGFFRRNRERLLRLLRESAKFDPSGLLFLSGPRLLTRNDDDAEERVIFEPFFYYLFGVTEETDTYGVIEIASGKATLFTRLPDPSEVFWSKYKSLEELKQQFEVDDAKSTADLEAFLDSKGDKKDVKIYLNAGASPVSLLPTATPLKEFKQQLEGRLLNLADLYPYGREARLFKSDEEVKILKDAIKITAFAHRSVMKMVVPGVSERQLSDYFTSLNVLYDSDIPYGNIFCAGANGAYLHYIPDPNVPFEDGQLVLNDSGSKLHGYNSDITRTFPVNGKFTAKQRQIYNLVLLAQKKALELTRPGVLWIDTHNIAMKTIAEGLLGLGLVTGNLDDELKLKVAKCFMPHGLGHYIGLYVHDMPGLEQYTITNEQREGCPGAIRRTLCKGMVITVEPGIYFNEVLLAQSYADPVLGKLLVRGVIEEYKREVGGVRIEDMYLVTENGFEDLSAELIKTADEIEAFMRR